MRRTSILTCVVAGILCGSHVAFADDAPSLTNGATRIEAPNVTLKAGDLQLVLANNAESPGHGGGYNGISILVHKAQREPLFLTHCAGLNFEHVFDGQVADYSPREGPLSLWRFGEHSAGIYRAAADCKWGLENLTRVTVVAPHYIDVEFTAVPHQAKFAADYIGLFWASYMNGPGDGAIYFLGRDKGDRQSPSRWIAARSPAHTVESSHVARDEPAVWGEVAPRGWPGLGASFSKFEFDAPFYYGRSRNMVWVYMFDQKTISPTHTLRFSQAPAGAGPGNPAWDFYTLVRPYRVGQPFGWRARCIYKPFVSGNDVLKEYRTWSGRSDLKSPPDEPPPVEGLPAPHRKQD